MGEVSNLRWMDLDLWWGKTEFKVDIAVRDVSDAQTLL
jgi:hypothetical protein